MNCKIFSGCFLLLVSLASPLFPNDSKRGEENNFVMYIEEQYVYPPNVCRTAEGSYVLISQGDRVRKISESGELLWQQILSLRQLSNEYLWLGGIAETDHGYMLVGAMWDSWEEIPVRGVIVLLGTDGSVQWSKTFESNEQIAFDSVSMTADRGYLVRGRSGTTRAVLVKFTAKGEILWSKIFNDLPHWSIISQPVSDGIILASARVPVRIFKVNDSGSVVWKKSLEINGFFLQSMGASSDNGVILAGKSSHKITLVQINPDGDVDWTAAYLLKDRLYDISSVARTSDRGYVVSGTRYSDESYETAGGFFIKLDSKQELVFQKKFGRTDRKEYAGQIFPTTNASYVIFGFSVEESDLHTLFLNVNSEGVVPNCGFFDHLSVKKMSSPHVRSQNRGIFSRDFTLSSHSIDVSQAISASSSFMACRE